MAQNIILIMALAIGNQAATLNTISIHQHEQEKKFLFILFFVWFLLRSEIYFCFFCCCWSPPVTLYIVSTVFFPCNQMYSALSFCSNRKPCNESLILFSYSHFGVYVCVCYIALFSIMYILDRCIISI